MSFSSIQHTLTPGPVAVGTRYRAPSEDGGILSQPPIGQGRAVALQNSDLLRSATLTLGGKSLAEFRDWTRTVCLTAAHHWMYETLGQAPGIGDGPLYVTGHQPSLNHAGVWMKNVAVSHLARCVGSTGLNLIVDNDLAGPPSIRVPAGTRTEPRFESVEYDADSPTQPWEERRLQNAELFASFPERVAEAMKPWGITPSLTNCWPAAIEASQKTDQIAFLLTAARVEHEHHWGIANLELPVSLMCQTEPFLLFAQSLIQRHEEFFQSYNEAVHWYRRTYKIRNHRHPVPDLEQMESRFELPFWYWEAGEVDRQRLFAERQGNEIALFAGAREVARLPGDSNDLSALQELQNRGRLRTRALTTTLFTRLCLADLFVHGIGGARYDEITNRLFSTFYGIQAPVFLTLTATVRLPLNAFPVSNETIAKLSTQLRRLQFEGPTGDAGPEVAALKAEQNAIWEEARSQRNAGHSRSERRGLKLANRQRHLRLKQVQKRLGELAADQIEETRQKLEEAFVELRANQILKSREYPVSLFQPEHLRGTVNRLRNEVCGSLAAY
ncbi:hypothetical protein [Planctomicrobium sp. SH527]|uniref:hypothetical protein n=1 Tax=Planctomicrobium sp. SH527 TaxID=3448123 RepID=UPI003F5C5B26